MQNAPAEFSLGYSEKQIFDEIAIIILLSAIVISGFFFKKLRMGKMSIIVCLVMIYFVTFANRGKLASMYARPHVALYQTGLCYYHDVDGDRFYAWDKISNLIERTGRRKELLFIYNGTENVSIPKLTIEIADMKRKFEDLIAKSQLIAKTDQPFQCPALETIVSLK